MLRRHAWCSSLNGLSAISGLSFALATPFDGMCARPKTRTSQGRARRQSVQEAASRHRIGRGSGVRLACDPTPPIQVAGDIVAIRAVRYDLTAQPVFDRVPSVLVPEATIASTPMPTS